MIDQPLVSVIIATYNMSQYVCDAIDSVLGQTWENLELIIIDDGSEDDTQDKLKKYQENQKFRYYRYENAGQTVAKNRGIKKAKGNFIGFCDADDLWESNKLELQMPSFCDPDVGVVYSEVSYIDAIGDQYERPKLYQRHIGHVTRYIMMENFVPFGTAVIRRECVKRDGAFDERYRMGIDWDLWLRYSINWKFSYIPHKTYIYREWEGQMSNNHRGRYRFAFEILGNFEKKYGSCLNPEDVDKAWADLYISRGLIHAEKEGLIIQPLRDIVEGLRKYPFYLKGWKSLIKVLLRHN